jgi:nicotinamidase-related amidase
LALAPLGRRAVHVAIDLQRMFAEPGAWQVAGLARIVPHIAAITETHRDQTVFMRFVVPRTAEEAEGRWRHYYRRWEDFAGDRLPAGQIELVDALARLAEPRRIFDKATYSAFTSGAFVRHLAEVSADTLIVTGVETDVCVLATLLDAVDRGLRVVAVADALASSSPAGHSATLDHVLPRFDHQIDIASAAEVLAAWAI